MCSCGTIGFTVDFAVSVTFCCVPLPRRWAFVCCCVDRVMASARSYGAYLAVGCLLLYLYTLYRTSLGPPHTRQWAVGDGKLAPGSAAAPDVNGGRSDTELQQLLDTIHKQSSEALWGTAAALRGAPVDDTAPRGRETAAEVCLLFLAIARVCVCV